MSSYTWNGGVGSYLDPSQWTPATVPLYGSDTVAAINVGTVSLSDAELNGITLFLGSLSDFSPPNARLVLSNAALGPEMTLNLNHIARLEVDGYDTNFGTIALGDPSSGTSALVNSSGFGQLNQLGTVTVGTAAQLGFAAGVQLNNEGLIELTGGLASTDGTISGNGTIKLAALNSGMDVRAGVDAGQSFLMQQGTLTIEDYNSFHGTLASFDSSATIVTLRNVQFDAATYARDASGEHLILINNGQVVGELQLADTPDTQYAVTKSDVLTTIRPTKVYSDGSIPASITAEEVIIRNAEPNGQTVALGGPTGVVQTGSPNLLLDNAALGPDFVLTVAAPDAMGPQTGTLMVQGYDTNFGEIDVIPSADAQTTARGNTLTIAIQPGSQLNQEGVLKIISPQTSTIVSSSVFFSAGGTLNNDGQILIEPGSFAGMTNAHVIGSGTITVDHGSLALFDVAGSQTIDFLGGSITAAPATFQATIKDWNNDGSLILPSDISSLQFNQTSAAGGDLQFFNGTAQVGTLHLRGTYATADFKLTQAYHEADISLSGHAPSSA